jgi:prepilin-type N-terminal cleavage/methylation domain-containing protein
MKETTQMCHATSGFSSRHHRSGLTLLELIIVVAILATLAGLVVSKIDWSRRQADMAASADTCAELARNIQLYYVETSYMPNGLDSLLVSGGTRYSKLFSSLLTATGSSHTAEIETGFGTADPDRRMSSLTRAHINMVFDHDEAVSDANVSATIARNVDATGSSFLCVNPGSSLWNAIYPPDNPDSPTHDQVSLVMLGVGARNSMIGRTIAMAPMYSHTEPDEGYNRYIAIFAAYRNGSRAQLKMVVDSQVRTIYGAMHEFYQSAPEGLQ